MDNDFQYNAQAVIQMLSEQVAALTRDNAVLLSALRVEQASHQQTQAMLQAMVPAPEAAVDYAPQ